MSAEAELLVCRQCLCRVSLLFLFVFGIEVVTANYQNNIFFLSRGLCPEHGWKYCRTYSAHTPGNPEDSAKTEEPLKFCKQMFSSMRIKHLQLLFCSHSHSQRITVWWNLGRAWLRCIVILWSYEWTWKFTHNLSKLNSTSNFNLTERFNNPGHVGDMLNFWYLELFQRTFHSTSILSIILSTAQTYWFATFFWWITRQRKVSRILDLDTSWISQALFSENSQLGYPTLCLALLKEIVSKKAFDQWKQFFPLLVSTDFYLKTSPWSQD